jgi:hypothetical protein
MNSSSVAGLRKYTVARIRIAKDLSRGESELVMTITGMSLHQIRKSS